MFLLCHTSLTSHRRSQNRNDSVYRSVRDSIAAWTQQSTMFTLQQKLTRIMYITRQKITKINWTNCLHTIESKRSDGASASTLESSSDPHRYSSNGRCIGNLLSELRVGHKVRSVLRHSLDHLGRLHGRWRCLSECGPGLSLCLSRQCVLRKPLSTLQKACRFRNMEAYLFTEQVFCILVRASTAWVPLKISVSHLWLAQ